MLTAEDRMNELPEYVNTICGIWN